MKQCQHCGHEVNDSAKFCGKCGFKFVASDGIKCPNCGKDLRSGAKFCGGCGTKIQQPITGVPQAQQQQAQQGQLVSQNKPDQQFALIGSYIHWNILPGQIAVKIDEDDIYALGKCVKGVNIQDGLKALLLVQGKVVAELPAGSYPFKDFGSGDFSSKDNKFGQQVNDAASVSGTPCPKCGNMIASGKKFCSKCGANVNTPAEAAKMEHTKGFLRNLFGAVGGAVSNAWNRITGREAEQRAENAGLVTRIPTSVPPISIVLIRSTEFPLVFSFKAANTANIRSDVGLHLLCKITNINDFYANMLLDRKMVCYENISQILAPLFQNEVNLSLTGITPEVVSNNGQLQATLLPKLQALMPGVYPYIAVSRILNLTAAQEDLDNLRKLSEELYVSEQELAQAMKRNEFLNRLQSVRNEQELRELREGNVHKNELQDVHNEQEIREIMTANAHHNSLDDIRSAQELTDYRRSTTNDVIQAQLEAEFEASKEKIYEQMALTQDEKAKFDMMLNAQRQLREAKSEDEVAAAMHTFEQSGLLRQQEMDNLRHQITHNARMRDLNDVQMLAVTTMNNQQTLEQQKVEWEIQIAMRKLQNDIERQRMQDDFDNERRDKEEAHSDARRDAEARFVDTRREADAQFSDSRRNADAQFEDERRRSQINLNREERRANIELDLEEQQNQMDMLRQAQAMRMEREDAEHRRDMEAMTRIHQNNMDDKRLDMEAEQRRMESEALREKQRLDSDVAKTQIYAGMSAEAIMAANPNLSEHAARALEAKYKNDNAVQAANENAQMAMDMQNQMNAFMQQQMQNKDKDTQDMRNMMMQMMQMNNQQNMQQMQMMRDQATAFAGAGAVAQQKLMEAKQQELDHTRADAAANSDRFVDGMKTTINAVGNMNPMQFIPVQPAYGAQPVRQKNMPLQQVETSASTKHAVLAVPAHSNTAMVCPHCNAPIEEGAMFCGECGAGL